MSTKARYANGQIEYFESTTQERVLVTAPVVFFEDFLGKALNTSVWGTRDTGAATEAYKAAAPNGVVELALDNTNEAQLAGLDWADFRPLAIANGLVFEAKYRFTVIPTTSAIACIGLCGNHNAAVDTVAESIWFRHDFSGLITVEADDTSHETSKVTTGKTLALNEWTIVRVDLTTPSDCLFFVNGNRVASTTTFNFNQVTTLVVQPVARIGKEGVQTHVGTLELDYVKLWSHRS